jgi:hypothetical protein
VRLLSKTPTHHQNPTSTAATAIGLGGSYNNSTTTLNSTTGGSADIIAVKGVHQLDSSHHTKHSSHTKHKKSTGNKNNNNTSGEQKH